MELFNKEERVSVTLQESLQLRGGLEGRLRGGTLEIFDGARRVLTVEGEAASRLFQLQEQAFIERVPDVVRDKSRMINRSPVCFELLHCVLNSEAHPRSFEANYLSHPLGAVMSVEDAISRLALPIAFQVEGHVVERVFYPDYGTEPSYEELIELDGIIHVGAIIGLDSETQEPIVFEKRGTLDPGGTFRHLWKSLEYYTTLGTVHLRFIAFSEIMKAFESTMLDELIVPPSPSFNQTLEKD